MRLIHVTMVLIYTALSSKYLDDICSSWECFSLITFALIDIIYYLGDRNLVASELMKNSHSLIHFRIFLSEFWVFFYDNVRGLLKFLILSQVNSPAPERTKSGTSRKVCIIVKCILYIQGSVDGCWYSTQHSSVCCWTDGYKKASSNAVGWDIFFCL